MLDVKAVGLIDLIRERLLRGSKTEQVIRAELYNLNVYGREYSAIDSDLYDRALNRRRVLFQGTCGYAPQREYVRIFGRLLSNGP